MKRSGEMKRPYSKRRSFVNEDMKLTGNSNFLMLKSPIRATLMSAAAVLPLPEQLRQRYRVPLEASGEKYEGDGGLKVNIVVEKPKPKKKTVRFAAETKQHDGTCWENHDLDTLLYQFLVKRVIIGEKDILNWTDADIVRISALLQGLSDVLHRLESLGSPEEMIPVLPRGGGTGMRVTPLHLPYLQSLKTVVLEAHHIASDFQEEHQVLNEDEFPDLIVYCK